MIITTFINIMEFTGAWRAPQPVSRRLGSGIYLAGDVIYDAAEDSCWYTSMPVGSIIRGRPLSTHSFIVDGDKLAWIYYGLDGATVRAKNVTLTIPADGVNIRREAVTHIEIISDTECELIVSVWIFRLRVTDPDIRHGISIHDGQQNMKWGGSNYTV